MLQPKRLLGVWRRLPVAGRFLIVGAAALVLRILLPALVDLMQGVLTLLVALGLGAGLMLGWLNHRRPGNDP